MPNLVCRLGIGLLVVGAGFSLAQSKSWIAASTPPLERALAQLPQTPYTPLGWATLDDLERLELLAVQTQMLNPPRTARALALLSVAVSDTLTVLRGRAGAEANVAVAFAAREVLLYLHPTFPNFKDAVRDTVQDLYGAAAKAGASPQSLLASSEVGRQIGVQVVAFARKDGANHQTLPEYPKVGPGIWALTLGYTAVEPGWGNLVPIGVMSAQLARANPPPAWDSPEFARDRAAFWQEQQKLSDQGKALADKWAGDGGTVTPAGLWQETVVAMLKDRKASAEAAVAVLAPLNIAMHDAFIACWRDKFTYYTARPNQWVKTFDQKWTPYLRTPKFPSYPSGHATISGAAAAVLSALLPEGAATFEVMAKEATYSRIVAGIHWFLDGSGGLDLGQRVGQQVLEAAGLVGGK
jgi:hypothetical protein